MGCEIKILSHASLLVKTETSSYSNRSLVGRFMLLAVVVEFPQASVYRI